MSFSKEPVKRSQSSFHGRPCKPSPKKHRLPKRESYRDCTWLMEGFRVHIHKYKHIYIYIYIDIDLNIDIHIYIYICIDRCLGLWSVGSNFCMVPLPVVLQDPGCTGPTPKEYPILSIWSLVEHAPHGQPITLAQLGPELPQERRHPKIAVAWTPKGCKTCSAETSRQQKKRM